MNLSLNFDLCNALLQMFKPEVKRVMRWTFFPLTYIALDMSNVKYFTKKKKPTKTDN